jgi:hypothetical protein
VIITPAPNLPTGQVGDADFRVAALETLALHLDTDVLQILASKAHKLGINGKVRMMQNLI